MSSKHKLPLLSKDCANAVLVERNPRTVEVLEERNCMLPRKASETLEAAYVKGLPAMRSQIRFDLCEGIGVHQQIV